MINQVGPLLYALHLSSSSRSTDCHRIGWTFNRHMPSPTTIVADRDLYRRRITDLIRSSQAASLGTFHKFICENTDVHYITPTKSDGVLYLYSHCQSIPKLRLEGLGSCASGRDKKVGGPPSDKSTNENEIHQDTHL